MYDKNKIDDIAKDKFNKRVVQAKQDAIKENIDKAKTHGNKLMQSIDEDGNLVNQDRMDVPGNNLLFGDGANDDIATADLRRELFEDENVIIGVQKDSDHGASEILKRQQEKDDKDQ